jgi:hypothetical protein
LRDLAALIASLLDGGGNGSGQVADRAALAPGDYEDTDRATTASTTMTTSQDPGHRAPAADDELRAAVAESVKLLHRFADYHEAEDKAAFLQRCDPDLAIAIRRIWQPEDAEQPPEDERTGRRRGR